MDGMRKSMLVLGVLVAGGLAGECLAAPDSPAYRDQLQRCVVALRPRIADPAAAAVRHTVTEVRVRGVWREFTIASDVLTGAGERLRETRSLCRVDRWTSAVQLRALAIPRRNAITVAENRG